MRYAGPGRSHREDPDPRLLEPPWRPRVHRRVRDRCVHRVGRADPGERAPARLAGIGRDAHAPGARTDPAEARAFVPDSQVDALAVAVGSVHAMTTRTAALDHRLLARLRAGVDVPLVPHGSSGVPDDELRAAVAGGITKVNIGTALNQAMTGAIRDHLAAHPEAVDSRGYLAVAREAMAYAVERISGVLTPA